MLTETVREIHTQLTSFICIQIKKNEYENIETVKIHFKTDKLLYVKTFNCRFIFHRHSNKINILKKFNYTLTCYMLVTKDFFIRQKLFISDAITQTCRFALKWDFIINVSQVDPSSACEYLTRGARCSRPISVSYRWNITKS